MTAPPGSGPEKRDRPLRVALVLPYYDPRVSGDPAVRLARFPTLPELAGELARLGLDVHAFHLSDRSATARWSGVDHHFVPTGPLRRALARMLWRRAPRFRAPYYDPAFELVRRVMACRPDVVHAFGLNLDVNVALLAAAARRRGVPLVVHFHGGEPARDSRTRSVQRASVAQMSRVLFTHPVQALPWRRDAGLRSVQVHVVTETSTRMARVSRPAAQDRSLCGDPVCAIVGRLHAVKDPATALAAFAQVADALPGARLHVFGGLSGLGARFPALIQAVPGLSERVVFHDYTKSRVLARYLAQVDILLQASRREWSGLSVIEALATGVVPVVTDIPALRTLTGAGRVGRLVPAGDARAMADAVIALAADRAELRRLSLSGREWFDAQLSFGALARELAALYGAVVAGGAEAGASGRRTRRSPASTVPPGS